MKLTANQKFDGALLNMSSAYLRLVRPGLQKQIYSLWKLVDTAKTARKQSDFFSRYDPFLLQRGQKHLT